MATAGRALLWANSQKLGGNGQRQRLDGPEIPDEDGSSSMSSDTFHPEPSYTDDEAAVRGLYKELMAAWKTPVAKPMPVCSPGMAILSDLTVCASGGIARSPRSTSGSLKRTSRERASSARSRMSGF